MYRQHNSPDRFQSYFEETIEKLTSTGNKARKDFKNNNEVSRDPTRIPNILNEHFATVGQKLANINYLQLQNVSLTS